MVVAGNTTHGSYVDFMLRVPIGSIIVGVRLWEAYVAGLGSITREMV